jgi:hypothetical protein
MADNLGPSVAPLKIFQKSYKNRVILQKITLRAEDPSGPKSNSEKDEKTKRNENGNGTINYFLHEVHIF